MSPKADWIHWWMQFALGGLAGFVLSAALTVRRGSTFFGEHVPSLLMFHSGGALLVGGLAAAYGDRFWFGRRTYMDARREHGMRTKFSRRLGMGIALFGAALMLGAITWSSINDSGRGDDERPPPIEWEGP